MHEIRFRFDEAAAFYGNLEDDTPLRVALPGSVVALDGDRRAWFSEDGTRVERLGALEAAVLEACDVFQRPGPQAADVADRTGLSLDEAARTIESLAARGLLATPIALLGDGLARDHTPVPAPLVAIRAHGDASQLAALLDSLLAEERRLGVQRRYVVCDEVDAPAVRDATRRFAAQSASTIWHCGARERDALSAPWLAAADGAGRDALAALLQPDPLAPGSCARNWAVLLSAGGTFALLDDAHRMPVREPVGTHFRLELNDSPEVETRFFDDEAGWQERPLVDGDAFAIAARWVGQPVRAIVPLDDARFVELENAPMAELARATPRARVVCASIGTYGEMPAHAWPFVTSRRTLSDLWRAPFQPARLAGAHTWNGVRAPRLMYAVAGVPLLVDNRELLPFGHDDDGFARLLQAIEPGAACVWLPLLLGHFPAAPPTGRPHDGTLASLVASFGAGLAGERREPRFAAIAALCRELASAGDDALAARADGAAAVPRAEHARRLAVALARPDAPAPWRERAVATLRGLRESLRADRPVASVPALRAQLARLANAAAPWTAAWHACRARPPLDALAPVRA